jgi:UDP-N-acetylmuramoyl-L-alanyl-D-glutamate--2,6-diaminopimelate ligase
MLYPLFYPQLPAHRVAVTGTDGKTSVTTLLGQLWDLSGLGWATIGTLGVRSHPKIDVKGSLQGVSTPMGDTFFQILHECVNHKIQHVTFEATSHSLDQRRLWPLTATTAIFTNFTRDHLDYHKTLDAYWQAKCAILQDMRPQLLIIHNGIAKGAELAQRAGALGIEVLFYGPQSAVVPGMANATYSLSGKTGIEGMLHKPGTEVCFQIKDESWSVCLPPMTAFQLDNLLAALCAFSAEGGQVEPLMPALQALGQIDGRLELVTHPAGFGPGGVGIYVDYAHTPKALETILVQVRPWTKGRLHVVFGCGGGRDQGKRGLMGQVAQIHADHVIITDDNPRHEDPALIRRAILQACPKALEIAGRAGAIDHAVGCLEPGDVLIVAGKGHESVQIIGDQAMAFSDQECIRAALAAWSNQRRKQAFSFTACQEAGLREADACSAQKEVL